VGKPSLCPECAELQDAFRRCLRTLRRSSSRSAENADPVYAKKDAEPLHRLVSTRYGAPMLYNMYDLYVGRSLEVFGEWLGAELSLYESLLKEGSVAVEISANIGALTVPMASLVGQQGRVLCTEADPANSRLLSANVALSDLLNVDVVHVSVGATRGRLKLLEQSSDRRTFTDFRALPLTSRIDQASTDESGTSKTLARRQYDVRRVTLDSLTANLTTVDFIKIGFVEEALAGLLQKGGKRTLELHRPWLLLESPRGGEDALVELNQLLWDKGYECVQCDSPIYRPDNWRGADAGAVVLPPAGRSIRNVFCGHSARRIEEASAYRSALAVCQSNSAEASVGAELDGAN